MTIGPEMLMAYVDGELDLVSAKRVEKAAAGDPELAAEIARHRALRDRLRREFDPLASAAPPEAMVALLRDSAKVTELHPERRRRAPPLRWTMAGGAVAAALALGIVIGQGLPGADSGFATRGGALVARGETARALDGQLAAASPDANTRILLSFRNAEGRYCRAFETRAQSAIACREGGDWQVRTLRAVDAAQATQYRQAGSASAALMADAQEMTAKGMKAWDKADADLPQLRTSSNTVVQQR